MTINQSTEPECTSAKVLKSRPHPSLLRVISRKGKHPGRARRIKRWHRYQVGMSLLHCRETVGLDHLDILYYEKHGLMTLRPMTSEERREALHRWDGDSPAHVELRRGQYTPLVTNETSGLGEIRATRTEGNHAHLGTADRGVGKFGTTTRRVSDNVNPYDGVRDEKSYEEWRAYYSKQRAARDDSSTKTLQKVLAVMCGILALPFVLLGMRKTKE